MAARSERTGRRSSGAGRGQVARSLDAEIKERDERYQRLLRLSADFFWETDASHRLMGVVRGQRAITLHQAGVHIGKTRWELPYTSPDEAGWRAHRKTLDRHLSFRDFEYARLTPAGEERHVRISGEPIFAADGTFLGYRGYGQDITDLKQAEAALRRSEMRFRSLAELSSDWFWEQDEQFRFTFLSGGLSERTGLDAAQFLGQKRWEQQALNLSEADWARHRAQIERREPFFDFEMLRRGGDGRTVWVSISGEPVFGENGKFRGYRGVGRNITKRKRAEQLLALEHTVARCLAAADNISEALKAVIRAVCETENWQCGRYFRVDEEAGVMRFAEFWSVPGAGLERFIEGSRGVIFAPGDGTAGKVWQSGQPLWVADIGKDPRALRRTFALEPGIRGGFFFPVISEGKTIGVLAFNSREIHEPDEWLLQVTSVIGSQIGQFLDRKQAEKVLRESEERFRSLAKLSSDWYWEQDSDFRYTYFESLGGTGNSAPPQLDYRGKLRWEIGLEIEGGWESHRALLRAHKPFRDLALSRQLDDGSFRHVRVSGEPVFDREGRFAGYRGVTRDITEHRRGEKLVALEHAVARSLAAADNAADALKAIIRAVCETENWAFGRYFRVDEEAGVLRFGESWSVPGGGIEKFITGLSGVVFKPGVGLAGRVWQTGQPLWIADINTDKRAIQAPFVAESGIRGAFVFPVLADGKTIGVFAFNSRQLREPDERLLQAVRVIGSQIGQFLRRKIAEEELRGSEERFRSLVELVTDWYWEQDEHYRFTFMSGGRNSRPVEILGKTPWECPGIEASEEHWAGLRADMDARRPYQDFVVWRTRRSGGRSYHPVSGRPVFDAAGNFKGYRGTGRDITQRMLTPERVEHLAYHDALTGLKSRSYFTTALARAVQQARRSGRRLALIFIDLDEFKTINDTLGHDAGDHLLKEIAARLIASLRKGDLIARLGGDEFVVLIEDAVDRQRLELIANKLPAEIVKPCVFAGSEMRVTASVGISVFPEDAGDEHGLVRNADAAMYRGKQRGKNAVCFYSDPPDA